MGNMSSKYDHDSIINTAIKWTALVVTIAGAICNAYLFTPLNVVLGNVGAILYMIWAIRTRDLNIALVNAALFLIYASGLLIVYSK